MSSYLEVPWLRQGAGHTPADGGCVMQVIDWISRNGWSDRPTCVNPLIRVHSIWANDGMEDESRQRLLLLVPRLMNTAVDDPMLNLRLSFFLNQMTTNWVREDWVRVSPSQMVLDAVKSWIDAPSRESLAHLEGEVRSATSLLTDSGRQRLGALVRAVLNVAEGNHYYIEELINSSSHLQPEITSYCRQTRIPVRFTPYDVLVQLLNEFDRLTGREVEDEVDFSGVCEVMPREKVFA